MNPGLRYLVRSLPRQTARSVRKRFRGWKGGIGFVVIVVFGVAILVPQFLANARPQNPGSVAAMLADVRLVAPLGMFAMMAMTLATGAATRRGVYFRPAEIDFLFPAPISRRQLLVYNLVRRIQVQALSALWISVFVARYAASYLQALVACFLALSFMEVTLQCLGLVSAALGQRISRPLRIAGGIALALLVALGLWRLQQGIPPGGEIMDVVRDVAGAPAVRVAVAPFAPFVNAFTATTFAGQWLWMGASVLLLLAAGRLMFSLDVAYEEASLEVSRNVRKRLAAMRGGGAWAALGTPDARRSLPRFPRMRGAGALCWRQGLEALRNVRGIVVMTGLTLLWPAAVGGVILAQSGGQNATLDPANGLMLILMVLFFSATLTQNLAFDFRRDLDRMPYLRSLPLSPTVVAAGQVAPAALLLGTVQFIAVAALAVLFGVLEVWLVPFLYPVLVLLAWIVVAVDNGLFLLLPYSVAPEDSGQMGFMGRLMLVMTLKFLALGAVVLASVLLGAVVWGVCQALSMSNGASVAAAAVLASIALLGMSFVLTWGVGRAFDAFDPARDTPE